MAERELAEVSGVFVRAGTAKGLLCYLKEIVRPYPDLGQRVASDLEEVERLLDCNKFGGAKLVVCRAINRVIQEVAKRRYEHLLEDMRQWPMDTSDEECRLGILLMEAELRRDWDTVNYLCRRLIAVRREGRRNG